ncbi:MAG: recombinase A [Firmicutes bacterium]|nr:recombinase A [Bacillota bacterium]
MHLATARPEIQPGGFQWTLAAIAGRLVEVTGAEDTAALTMVVQLLLDAQQQGEQTAWVACTGSLPFPPDLLENGLDLEALIVVRVPDLLAGARAADSLIRSGAFGLVVVDADGTPRIPTPVLARLASLAQRHHTALIFLTRYRTASRSASAGTGGTSPLGSLISLRVRARRQRLAADRFRCWLEVLKDKRRGPTWGVDEVCRGAPGMR